MNGNSREIKLNVDSDYHYITLTNGRINLAGCEILSDPIEVCSDEYKNKEHLIEMIEKQISEYLQENITR